jgi:hypothetical protein
MPLGLSRAAWHCHPTREWFLKEVYLTGDTVDDNFDYETEINSLKSRIADLEGELAIAKSQIPQVTWFPTQGAAAQPLPVIYTTNTTSTALPMTFRISGSNWCGT